MGTIKRTAVTVLGGIAIAFIGGGIVHILAKMAGVNTRDGSITGVLMLAIVIGTMIVIWRQTGSGPGAVNVSSVTPQ